METFKKYIKPLDIVAGRYVLKVYDSIVKLFNILWKKEPETVTKDKDSKPMKPMKESSKEEKSSVFWPIIISICPAMFFGDIGIPKKPDGEEETLPSIRVMDELTGKLIELMAFMFGAIVFGTIFSYIPLEFLKAIGLNTNLFQLIITGILVWLTIFVVWNIVIPAGQEYLVIERLGKFYGIKHSGIGFLCFRGIIDKVRDSGNLKVRELKMYADEKDDFAIDFKDGSAPIDASIWHRIGKENSSWDEINRAIIAHVYAYKNPEGRVEEIVDGHTRPLLQSFSIDDAQEAKDSIAEKILGSEDVKRAMRKTGHFFVENKGLIISDIILPEEIRNLRRQVLEGKKDAERDIKKGAGYALAIKEVINKLGTSTERGIDIYQTQRGFETIETTGSNVTFVAPDMKGLLVTVGAKSTDQTGGEQ